MIADTPPDAPTSPRRTPCRHILIGLAVFAGKLCVLYLAQIALTITVVLMQTALPRAFFQTTPFVAASCGVIACGLIISRLKKSKTPLLATVFSVALATFAFTHTGSSYVPLMPFKLSHAALFVLFFSAVAAINYLYRNRFTEPLLVILPIYAGAWLFLLAIYEFAFIVWARAAVGQLDAATLGNEALASLKLLPAKVAIMLPVLLFYALGKHAHRPLFNHLQRLWS